MILVPCAVFIVSLPFSARLRPGICKAYRIIGGLVVTLGGAISLYFAAYTGDQGSIGAFFFQSAVILFYAVLSILLVVLNWYLNARDAGVSEA